jgi:hypothetical protein
MVQFPAPRWLYLVQGSLDQISVNHPEKHTHFTNKQNKNKLMHQLYGFWKVCFICIWYLSIHCQHTQLSPHFCD